MYNMYYIYMLCIRACMYVSDYRVMLKGTYGSYSRTSGLRVVVQAVAKTTDGCVYETARSRGFDTASAGGRSSSPEY